MFNTGSFVIVFLIFLSNSVTGSGLYGSCERHEQCGTFDTFCKNGTCVCRDGFIAFFDSCMQLTMPQKTCNNKAECRLIPRSICKEGYCACKPFHHLHEGQCVKSRGLDEFCENNHQCYCGRNCHGIECVHRLCRCKFGYHQIGRRCITNHLEEFVVREQTTSSTNTINYSPTIPLLLYGLFLYNFR